MNIWTIKEGEPLPIAGCPGRQMRCGIISEMLVERGHDVTWWTSDFFHQTKTRLRDRETVINLGNHYRLHMLHANTVYKKNISLERIRYSKQLGKAFKSAAIKLNKPDVIFCAFPLIDFAYEAVQYAKKNNVPIIVDVRDLWPDIIWEHFPAGIQGVIKSFCRSMIKKTEYVMKNADVVIGVVPCFVEFSKNHGRIPAKEDGIYYLAYREKALTQKDREKSVLFWKEKGIYSDDFLICWIGQISSKRTNFEMVCNIIAQMPFCKFVICGDGVSKQELEKKYKQYSNIIFPGFLNQEELETLMEMSAAGVIPIRNTPDFINHIDNKAIEYMAGSLCIFTTLKGFLREIIEHNEFGFYFEDEEGFRKALERIMKSPELLKKYKLNARAFYEANFSSINVYGKLCELIESLV